MQEDARLLVAQWIAEDERLPTVKKTQIERAIDNIQRDIDILESAKARLIASHAPPPPRAPRKRTIKAVEQKAG